MQKLILNQIRTNKLAHSYLLVSENKAEMISWFKALKEKLLVSAADIFQIDNEKQIKIEDIRNLQRQIKLKPHSSNYKLFFIYNADYLRKEAANALLKTLEEPPGNSLIILASSSSDKLLPTITSRCQIVRFNTMNKKVEKFAMAEELKKINAMKIYEKFAYIKKIINKEEIDCWVEELIHYLRKGIIQKKNQLILKKLLKYQRLLKETNANKQLILENLILEMEY